MEESKEELKSLLKKVKEESKKVGLALNIQETKIMASGPITFIANSGNSDILYFGGGSKLTALGMTEDEMAGWHHRLDGRESQ